MILFNSAIASLNITFHLSPRENILTIALINIHYLYTIAPPGKTLRNFMFINIWKTQEKMTEKTAGRLQSLKVLVMWISCRLLTYGKEGTDLNKKDNMWLAKCAFLIQIISLFSMVHQPG